MQKYFGFDTYETRWLNNGGATTHIIHSGIRYFSFFTDASNMGSNMGGAGIIFGITSLYMKNKTFKIYYASVAIASLVYNDAFRYSRGNNCTTGRISTLYRSKQTDSALF